MANATIMTFGIVLERIETPDFPAGYYYAHVPGLGLTTHGLGIEGAKEAARDLIQLWVAEKHAHGEAVTATSDWLISTIEVPENAEFQSL